MKNKYGIEELNEFNSDFFGCDNRLEYDDMVAAYHKLFNQNTNLLFQIKNLKDKVAIQEEKIKSLCYQINLLNRAIVRYKNGKN